MCQGKSVPPRGSLRSLLRSTRGFTLIELLITVVVVAIGVALEVPSWENLVQKRNVSCGAEDIAAFFSYAQSTAVKKNEEITVTLKRVGAGATWCVGAIDEETKDEKPNLQESRRDYQKRIDKLVFQKKEAERREKAALDFAKGLQKKFDQTSLKFKETDEQCLKEFDARVVAQREQVKVALKQAIETNDATQIMEANDKLTQLAVEKEKARQELSNRERQKKDEEQKTTTTNNVQAEPQTAGSSETPTQITPKAKKWAEENTWFGTDEVMTNAAITIHNNISQEGIEVDSDEYYNEVNSRLRKYFPESFDDTKDEPKKETPKPVQTVASAGRSQQGRRTVKLTKSQVAIAKRLGVPLEEYARYVKEDK